MIYVLILFMFSSFSYFFQGITPHTHIRTHARIPRPPVCMGACVQVCVPVCVCVCACVCTPPPRDIAGSRRCSNLLCTCTCNDFLQRFFPGRVHFCIFLCFLPCTIATFLHVQVHATFLCNVFWWTCTCNIPFAPFFF